MNQEARRLNNRIVEAYRKGGLAWNYMHSMLGDYLGVLAFQNGWLWPIACRTDEHPVIAAVFKGVPLYRDDLHPDVDIRDVLRRRLYAAQPPAVKNTPHVGEVFDRPVLVC